MRGGEKFRDQRSAPPTTNGPRLCSNGATRRVTPMPKTKAELSEAIEDHRGPASIWLELQRLAELIREVQARFDEVMSALDGVEK
jgi:hypothetical protein